MLRLICATELSYIRFSFERNNTLEGQFLGVRVFTLGREVFFNGMQLSIEATNVEKQFKTIAGRNVTAIKDLNLSIPARDFVHCWPVWIRKNYATSITRSVGRTN